MCQLCTRRTPPPTCPVPTGTVRGTFFLLFNCEAALVLYCGCAQAPRRAFTVAYVSGLMFILVRWCVRRAGMCGEWVIERGRSESDGERVRLYSHSERNKVTPLVFSDHGGKSLAGNASAFRVQCCSAVCSGPCVCVRRRAARIGIYVTQQSTVVLCAKRQSI